MTIIYQYKVASTSVCGFLKLLRRWRGSVYKLMFKEMLIFCGLYATISLIYRLALTEHQRSMFARIARYCNSYTDLIPVSFVLGFYVSFVVTRWWQQFSNVPWPDRTLFIMSTYLPGQDERARILRRTVARYMMFGFILIIRSISVAVMKRFPTLEHIVDAGFITTDEAQMYEKVCCKYNKFWVPLVWANNVLAQARREGRIESETGFRLIMEYLADFRDKCSLCFVYDWITIPLVYTQVVTLSVHIFFVACLIGRQYVDSNDDDHPDLYIPMFTLLQFFFYMGWLKVAEQLINPFGEDDDDFDMNWLLDRHASVAMCLVDQCHGSYPTLVKDVHFNEIVQDLPYTEASKASRRPNFMGSTYNLARPSIAEQRVISPINMPDYPMGIGRNRSNTARSGLNGSLWSLFGFKQPLQRSNLSGSRETMMSTSTVANGHAGLGPANHTGAGGLHPTLHRESYGHESDPGELPPYVPLRRARAGTDVDHQPLRRLTDSDRERKWSFPVSLLRRKHNREFLERTISETESSHSLQDRKGSQDGGGEASPLLSHGSGYRPNSPASQVHRTSRFTIESVPDDQEVDSSKAARNKALIDKHIGGYMSGLSVSRPPVLSAIEEGNTIRSIKELIPSPSSHSLGSVHELKEDFDHVINEEPDVDDVFLENASLGSNDDDSGDTKPLSASIETETRKDSMQTLPKIQVEES